MKTSYSKFGKNYRFYMGLSKRFQGFGFMWEEDKEAFEDYMKAVRNTKLFARPLPIEEWPNDSAKGSGGEFVIKN